MSRVANRLGIGDLAGNPIPRSRPMPDISESDKFRADVELLFPDSASARLSRALENSARNVQKWINGAESPPDHAVAFVAQQLALLEDLQPPPLQTLKTLVDHILASGVHPEVVAGMLSTIYDDVTGKSIR